MSLIKFTNTDSSLPDCLVLDCGLFCFGLWFVCQIYGNRVCWLSNDFLLCPVYVKSHPITTQLEVYWRERTKRHSFNIYIITKHIVIHPPNRRQKDQRHFAALWVHNLNHKTIIHFLNRHQPPYPASSSNPQPQLR